MNNEHPIKLGLALAVIAAISACLLAFTAELTRKRIEEVKEARVTDALRQVLPEFDNDPTANMVTIEQEGVAVSFYPATKGGKLVGIAATASSPQGYGGTIKVMASMAEDGRIITVIVTEQKETPGLGTAVTDRKRQKTLTDVLGSGDQASAGLPPNPVLDQFSGRTAADAPWRVRKDGGDIDEVTGATISSRAVTDAVNHLAQALVTHRAELMAKFATAANPVGKETAP